MRTSNTGRPLSREFFQTDPVTCARALIGCELFWGDCSGTVVETEAYALTGDEACHTFLRESARKFIREQPPGASYVYLNYGVHWLLNVLVKGGCMDGFVLFRALEPGRGVERMQERRGLTPVRALCSGPGKLSQAMGITGADHGQDLCDRPDRGILAAGTSCSPVADVRIGISRAIDFPWRFLMPGSAFLSVKPRLKTEEVSTPATSPKKKARPPRRGRPG